MPALHNAKQEHFAQLVSNGENPTRAYILAGYSEGGAAQSANRLLRNADVCSRIAELRAAKEQAHAQAVSKVFEKAALTKEWVIAQLMDNVAIAKAAEPVLDAEGNPTGEYKANIAAANGALKLLGLELGMFVERREVRTGPLSAATDDELDQIIQQAAQQAGVHVTH